MRGRKMRIANSVSGRTATGVEVFILASDFAGGDDVERPPFVLRWRDDVGLLEPLAWPAREDAIQSCGRRGVFRSHLEWIGPGEVKFLYRQGVIVHAIGDVLSREHIEDGICGGHLARDRAGDWIAALNPENDGAGKPVTVYTPRGDVWRQTALSADPALSLEDLGSWRGRVFVTALSGSIVEVVVGREGTGHLCPPLSFPTGSDDSARFAVVGDALIVAGDDRAGLNVISWVTEAD